MTASEMLPLIRAKGKGDRFSENLYKWVKKNGDDWLTVGFAQRSFLDGNPVGYDANLTQVGQIFIGYGGDERDFFCAKLGNILGAGKRAETYAISFNRWQIQLLPDWWQGYIKGGKCWIDPEHRLYMDKERWIVSDDGKMRSCLWCGAHRQYKHIEMVPRETWRTEEP